MISRTIRNKTPSVNAIIAEVARLKCQAVIKPIIALITAIIRVKANIFGRELESRIAVAAGVTSRAITRMAPAVEKATTIVKATRPMNIVATVRMGNPRTRADSLSKVTSCITL